MRTTSAGRRFPRKRRSVDAASRHEAAARYLEGDSTAAVAAAFGVHAVTVLAWVRAEGHEPRTRTDQGASRATRRSAVAMYLEGDPSAAVAAAFGVTRPTVLAWLRAEGHEPRSRRAGTAAQRAAAAARYQEGASARGVGAAFGVSAPTVLAWVRAEGHEPRSRRAGTAAQRAAAVARYQEGASARSVGPAFGVHAVTVLAWLRAEGHEPRSRRAGTAAQRAAAAARYQEGASARGVGAAFGVSAVTVLAWVRQAGRQPRKQGGVAARTARQRGEAIARYRGGDSSAAIGAAFGVSHQTVLRWVRPSRAPDAAATLPSHRRACSGARRGGGALPARQPGR